MVEYEWSTQNIVLQKSGGIDMMSLDKIIEIQERFEKMEIKSFAKDMIEFIDEGVSSYHVVKNCSMILEENGFERLNPKERWNLK